MDRLETTELSLPTSTGSSVVGAWQSNGGAKGHPARGLPLSVRLPIQVLGDPTRLTITGIFALFGSEEHETPGTIGASVQLFRGREMVFRQDLVNGRHYGDAGCMMPVSWKPGDGTSLVTVGEAWAGGSAYRLDALTIDLPEGLEPDALVFKDLGTPASFVIQSVSLETRQVAGCPFRESGSGVPLSELGAIVRLGDRPRFEKALRQMEISIAQAEDLDEARGQALIFLAVASAATIELGGGKSMHRVQLEAAREFELCSNFESLTKAALAITRRVTEPIFAPAGDPAAKIVDRALALVERNFAKPICDATIADQLGLSTSHFRFLFRQATGQPFHRYLVTYRLERARRLLAEQDMPVAAVAQAVGFSGVSHFSRAFSQKFRMSPTGVRRISA